jgi:hypothetical protein
VCGERLDPFLVSTPRRAPAPRTASMSRTPRTATSTPRRGGAGGRRWAAEEARRAALTPEERAEEDERAREWEYDEMRAAGDDDFDPYAKDYGDVD